MNEKEMSDMALGIILVAAGLAGLVYGIMKKNKILIVSSTAGLIIVTAVWIYFIQNPY